MCWVLGRQAEPEHGFAGSALRPCFSPVGFQDFLYYGEPDSSASEVSGTGFLSSIETLKNKWQVFGFNPRAAVFDKEFHRLARSLCADKYGPTLRSILQGVFQKIFYHPADFFAVGRDRISGFTQFRPDLDIFLFEFQIEFFQSAGSQFGNFVSSRSRLIFAASARANSSKFSTREDQPQCFFQKQLKSFLRWRNDTVLQRLQVPSDVC